MSKMICITGDGAFLASDNITAPDYVNITLMAQLNLFNNLVEQGADKARLYDMYNEAASAFLATFAPDIELRPDLTEEAILKAENELLKDKANKVIHMTPKQKQVEQLKRRHLNQKSPTYDADQPDPDLIKKIDEAGQE